MKTAIYAGSFDPVTFGHLDIIKRARATFNKVLVVIGSNPNKTYTLSLHVRTMLLRKLTLGMEGVEIVPIGNRLIVDYAFENNIKNIIKGVRNNQDFDYERMMHEVNTTQRRGIETHILISRPEMSHISSSAVKELSKYYGILHEYVPLLVKQTLEYANGQIIIGVTGSIGSGKSTVTKKILECYRYRDGVDIDLDKLAHELLDPATDNSPMAWSLRENIRNQFKLPFYNAHDSIDRKALGEKVFGNPEELTKLNTLFREPLLFKIRHKMAENKKKRFFLLNGALLAEAGLLSLCNNNVLLVTADASCIHQRLKTRGLNPTQILHRINSQWSFEKKKEIIDSRISQDKCGKLCVVDTSNYKLEKMKDNYFLNDWDLEQKLLITKNKDENPDSSYSL